LKGLKQVKLKVKVGCGWFSWR